MRTHFFMLGWALFMSTAYFSAYGADSGWEEYQLTRIEAIGNPPSSEEILLLATLSANEPTDPHVKAVKEKAWQRLSSLPDFPDQIIKSIHAERAKWKARGWPGEYDRVRFGAIEAMQKLEHPGIVRILGELLWDTERTVGEFEAGPPSNAIYASRSLAEMVEHPPVQRPPDIYREGDLETWQLWYEQVRAGTRTFRFKGNPQEYNLLGPASGAVTPASAKTSPSSAAATPETKGPAQGIPKLALIASSVLLGFAILALLKARKRKSA
jgi:hypothetical protein